MLLPVRARDRRGPERLAHSAMADQLELSLKDLQLACRQPPSMWRQGGIVDLREIALAGRFAARQHGAEHLSCRSLPSSLRSIVRHVSSPQYSVVQKSYPARQQQGDPAVQHTVKNFSTDPKARQLKRCSMHADGTVPVIRAHALLVQAAV